MKDDNRYLIKKSGRKTWLYRRRVPNDVKHLDARSPIIQKSTGQRKLVFAHLERDKFEIADDALWDALRDGADAKTARQAYDAAIRLNEAVGLSFPKHNLSFYETIKRVVVADRIVGKGTHIDEGPVDIPYTNTKTGEVEWIEEVVAVEVSNQPEVYNALLGTVKKPEHNVDEAFDFWHDELAHTVWKKKSPDQYRRWRNTRMHALGVYREVIGPDKGFISTSRTDAQEVFKYLNRRVMQGELKGDSARKDLSFLRKMWRELALYDGLDEPNPFREFRWDKDYTPRPPYSVEWLQRNFLRGDKLSGLKPEERHAIFVLIETGCRPAEIINLKPEHIFLEHDIPHIKVTDTADREVKTRNTVRGVPLVGIALEAMKLQPDGFPNYQDRGSQFSDTVNTYLTDHGLRETPDHVLYSVRHCFEDRLKDAGVGDDLRRGLMGHTVKDRPVYGRGFTLEAKAEALGKIVLPFDVGIL